MPGLKTLEQDMTLMVGKTYHNNDPVQFNKNGFHFCKRLEDTLHFFAGYQSDIDICEVIGYGTISEFSNDYYGYYDMYAASDIKIVRKLSKIEILNMYKELLSDAYFNQERISRFLYYYPNLNEEDYEYLGVDPKQYPLRYY